MVSAEHIRDLDTGLRELRGLMLEALERTSRIDVELKIENNHMYVMKVSPIFHRGRK